ncbi:cryptococcal mannosyltransferase 1-domain-containing protein [Aspergillus pseudotamarii]|uniref:Cryptococcal mannosyltransferase 1-domain-containing protein n=1 Tax=Aspergillus pseudotamarii TaxID=132259 RepID=A0A5N6SLS2_ASPPS|nr:cryptococcal mannosyltransferase 1-domain-containing protein [Aspergillus pseudotamarii]KAE8134641.1 cryptococcal mannosyltransferase 1-domain-containing protein [Aspergillus pseudotamarii]
MSSSRLLHPDEYELETRSSADSQESFNLDEADFESQVPPRPRRLLRRMPFLSRVFASTYSGYRRLKPSRPLISASARPSCLRRILFRRACFYLHAVVGIILALLILTAILRPSYTRPPPHYTALRSAVSHSSASGRGNPDNEKVFIAVSLYDRGGKLAQGQWGSTVLQLIDLLGEDNVFLSIYENDSGPEGESALQALEKQVSSNRSIIIEEHFDLSNLPRVTIPGGSKRTKRIDYLAEVRNRALRPLEESETQYDKLLYINDVLFDPIDALQLLFSTNVDDNGIAQYRAACAVDFSNPFKFYDTYATRDVQGYGMGLPFFPWFTSAGGGQSRRDVLAGKDAVRVRSCWGGMVAFDARFFQGGAKPAVEMGGEKFPVRFRSAPDLFWEASECCLIHADIENPPSNGAEIVDTGIYMNPFVRVAYDSRTLSWLWTTRRFEKLYSIIHDIGSRLVGMPWFNPRRSEVRGQAVEETVWVPNDKDDGGGSFQTVTRIAGNDGYCGRRGLQVIVEHRKEGQDGFESIPVPTSKVTGVIHSVFESFLERNTAHTLDESRHAPPLEDQDDIVTSTNSPSTSSSAGYKTPPVFHTHSPSPSLPSSYHPNINDSHISFGQKPVTKMYPIANVDDTAGFMAAARALKLDPNAYRKVSSVVAASEDASSEHGSLSKSHDDFAKTPTFADDFVNVDADFTGPDNDSTLASFVTEPMPLEVAEQSSASEFVSADTFATTSHVSVERKEDREYQTTFETWGTPELRDKPSARVRRVLIRGLPTAWKTPARVLSLIHGGTIESISVTPSGTAQILFCDAEACKAFYDKYPNGIDLDQERKVTVFVEMGREVDVVSSQLSFSLSTGATRAVRAVGVDLGVTMHQLSDLAAGNHRKVEKILDSYVPGEARNVIFRFCSINDAVRFRAVIVRNESWEQCNIQYAADPCELATGYHTN